MLSPDQSTTLADDLIAEHFEASGSSLHVAGIPVSELAAHYGTPLFIYHGGIMRRSYRTLATALGGFATIYYSVKANPAPAIIRLFNSESAGCEIASVGEYRAARAAGVAPERILFAGPAKRHAELKAVIEGGIGEIHVESFEEISRLTAIALSNAATIPVSIRVNPLATAQGGALQMGGRPSPFGFDEESLPDVVAAIRSQRQLELRGVHMFAGTQILNHDVLLTQWRHAIDVADRVARLAGIPLQTIDLGGGLGIPYFAGDKKLDLAKLSAGLPDLARRLRDNPRLAGSSVVVEPGRFLAGPAGIYVVSVNAAKISRGERFLVTDGGMHHHLAASGNLGQVIKRDYPIVAPDHLDALRTPATVAGPLCTPLDTLARRSDLPDLREGDLIAVLQSGAYGRTASPVGFLGHPAPAEILIDNGDIVVIDSGGQP